MKKLLLIAGIGILTLVSCGKSEPTTLEQATTFADSINIGLGQYLGALANNELSKFPELSKDEALKGMRYVLDTDTADRARFYGIDMGLNVLNSYYANASMEPIDVATFLNGFESEFVGNSAEADSREFLERYDRMTAEMTARRQLREQGAEVPALSAAYCDSLSNTLGVYYGRIGRDVRTEYLTVDVDSTKLMEQIRVICNVDTANRSYACGLAMGLNSYNYFYDQSMRIGGASREQFVAALERTFATDSVSSETLASLKAVLDPMTERSFMLQQQQQEKEVFDSKEAKENRMLGDAVAAKLISNPEFSAIGNAGLMMREIVAGNGKLLNPEEEVRIDVTARRIDSGDEVFSRIGVRIIAGNPQDAMLINLLPLMQMGETAEFFVPYTLAYGTLGMKRRNVGPCESLMVTISIKPI